MSQQPQGDEDVDTDDELLEKHREDLVAEFEDRVNLFMGNKPAGKGKKVVVSEKSRKE